MPSGDPGPGEGNEGAAAGTRKGAVAGTETVAGERVGTGAGTGARMERKRGGERELENPPYHDRSRVEEGDAYRLPTTSSTRPSARANTSHP